MGVPLFELRITDPEALRLELIAVDRYPPSFSLGTDGVAATAREQVLDRADLDFGLADLGEGTAAEIREHPLVADFLGRLDTQYIWEPLGRGVGRIVVSAGAATADWGALSRVFPEVAVLRRHPGLWSPGEFLAFPVEVGLVVDGSPDEGRAAGLFDDLVQQAASQGGVHWGAYEGAGTHLVHCTLSDPGRVDLLLPWPEPAPRVVVVHLTMPELLPEVAGDIEDRLMASGVGAVVVAGLQDESAAPVFGMLYRKLLHNWPLEYCAWAGAAALGVPAPIRVTAAAGGEFGLALSRIPAERAAEHRAAAGSHAVAPPPPVPPPPAPPPPAPPPVRPVEPPPDAAQPPAPPPPRRSWRGHDEVPFEPEDDEERAAVDDGGEWMGDEPAAAGDGGETGAAPSDRDGRAAVELADAADAAVRRELEPVVTRTDDLTFENEMTDLGEILDLTARAEAAGRDAATARRAAATAPPPPRRTNLTVFDPDTGEPLATDVPMRPRVAHTMTVAIEPTRRRAQVSAEFDEEPLRRVFQTQDTVDLDLVVFAPTDEFLVGPARATLTLPKVGPSQPVSVAVTPQRDGWCRLRVCLYYRNTLLQSVAMMAFAGPAAEATAPTVKPALDWVASTDLALLAELPEPAFNLVVNDAPDGTHWVGVFAAEGDGFLPLESGAMRKLDSLKLTRRVEQLRTVLQEVHGADDQYLYPQAPPTDPTVVDFGIAGLKRLALIGYRVYNDMFLSALDLSAEAVRQALAASGGAATAAKLISIARTGDWSAPWSALYDFELDVDTESRIEVCPVFVAQLAANEWSGDDLEATHDLLDDPAACRAQAECPLDDPERRKLTVCPFGFWGFRHQVEQPLQIVTPAGPGEVPPEMEAAAFSQTSFIMQQPGEELRVAGAVYPFTGRMLDRDMRDIEALFGPSFDWREDRGEVMELLESETGHHLFYFFCHGVEHEFDFALEVGPVGDPENTISIVPQTSMHWAGPATPQPLVILMACESLAMRPEVMNALFGGFKNAGASGIIGSEITIGTRLGHEFGTGLLAGLRDGTTAGEAFMALRRGMLRRYNPLGLALTLHAPATLHVHPASGECAVCARIAVARSQEP
jgi:hypothetical protein